MLIYGQSAYHSSGKPPVREDRIEQIKPPPGSDDLIEPLAAQLGGDSPQVWAPLTIAAPVDMMSARWRFYTMISSRI